MSARADFTLKLGTDWLIGVRDINSELTGAEIVSDHIKRSTKFTPPADDVPELFAFDVEYVAATADDPAFFRVTAGPEKTALLRSGVHIVDVRIDDGTNVINSDSFTIFVEGRVTDGP